jgi:pimeloyl-ACP methyl ester carboxylesterase
MAASSFDHLVRQDHFIESSTETGLTLRLRERHHPNAYADPIKHPPLLMVHGATIPSLLWDHPIGQWSWMNRLAADGIHVYALDIRGYGGSTRPTVLQASDPQNHPPYARAVDVQADLIDAIAFITKRHQVAAVDLLGGSWGSIVCGLFASGLHAKHIRRLILYAPIYDEGHTKTSWWHGAVDPHNHQAVNPKLGAFRWVRRESLLTRWDDEIPWEDKTAWRPHDVFEPLFVACLEEDPDAIAQSPAAFRAPNGTLVDLFFAYTGQPVFKAHTIDCPTLLIRGDHDDTASRIGALKLFDEIQSNQKVYVEVGNGAHFVILEKQSAKVHQAVVTFLQEPN